MYELYYKKIIFPLMASFSAFWVINRDKRNLKNKFLFEKRQYLLNNNYISTIPAPALSVELSEASPRI